MSRPHRLVLSHHDPEKLIPHLDGLVNYILLQQQNQKDPGLALDAWLTSREQSIIYDEDDADDADKEDRPKDLVKAQFQGRPARVRQESEDLGDDPEDEWTLRKCSAAALDVFAKDHLKETLCHPQWPNCWCLGRYVEWASHLDDPAQKEAAASAFAGLEEKSEANLVPYCEPILWQFVCFGKYQDRNMYILYDCIQTLAECHEGLGQTHPGQRPHAGAHRPVPSGPPRTLPPRMLGVCRDRVRGCFRPLCAPALPPVHQDHLREPAGIGGCREQRGPGLPDHQPGPAECEALVSSAEPRLFDLLYYCMTDPNNDCQSSYALLGDCAIYLFPQLQPYLPNVLPALIKQLDLDLIHDEVPQTGFSVPNNACWSKEVIDSVNENAALALGRLCIGGSGSLAPRLGEYADEVDVQDRLYA
ncbi:hypothetical protein Egran_06438 [Elaphomyces granulatus]|uniref:Uncharacterized protein n=1 Tax=Elaphomyces granulatus TaxID=519963 RepID=A0A232LNW8_9EURO|nr:hypothetical protein Egran_06438 [Elaphomyces granulatus]